MNERGLGFSWAMENQVFKKLPFNRQPHVVTRIVMDATFGRWDTKDLDLAGPKRGL